MKNFKQKITQKIANVIYRLLINSPNQQVFDGWYYIALRYEELCKSFGIELE